MGVMQNLASRFKLIPWTQYVGCWLAAVSLLVWALTRPGFIASSAHFVAVVGVLIALVGTAFALSHNGILFSLKHGLQVAGLVVSLFAAIFLQNAPMALFALIGLGVAQAGQWYDSLYT